MVVIYGKNTIKIYNQEKLFYTYQIYKYKLISSVAYTIHISIPNIAPKCVFDQGMGMY